MAKGRSLMFDVSNLMKCPQCQAAAVAPLPERILEVQTDGTTHVCLPVPPYNGCDQGYKFTVTQSDVSRN